MTIHLKMIHASHFYISCIRATMLIHLRRLIRNKSVAVFIDHDISNIAPPPPQETAPLLHLLNMGCAYYAVPIIVGYFLLLIVLPFTI